MVQERNKATRSKGLKTWNARTANMIIELRVGFYGDLMATKGLIRRNDVRGYRDGNAQDFLDAMIALLGLRNKMYDEAKIKDDDDLDMLEQQYAIELGKRIQELHEWNITQIGDLYWTSGGRIVLDKGYGEYFNEGDKKLFTLEELTVGMDADKFLARLEESKKGRRMRF